MRKATRRLLRELGIQSLYPPQKEAVAAGVEDGESVLVSAPTASGKTLVALIAAVNALTDYPGSLVIYTAPLRSIVFEKAEDFEALERMGWRLRVSVGDHSRGPRGADVLLTTYEKLDSMLRSDPGLAERVSLLVVDEVHYVGDEKRGPVLESLLSTFLSLEEPPQIVALSATVPNAGEIAGWLGARLVYSEWRPVPLREGVYKSGVIHYADGGEVRVPRRTGRRIVDLAAYYSSLGGQTLVFSQSRRRVASLARTTARHSSVLAYDPGVAARAARRIMETGGPRSMREELASLVARGVAYHHAGLSNEQRRIIEEAFREGGLAVVHATPTLAAGVNLPARAVVIEEYLRFEAGRRRAISVAEYKQMAGRAGRPGFDEAGDAIIVAGTGDDVEDLMELYVEAEPEPVESRLAGLRGLRHMALGLIASGLASSESSLRRIIARTLFARSRGLERALSLLDVALRDLRRWGLVGEGLEATPLGAETARLYLDPYTVPYASRLLSRARGLDVDKALFLVAGAPDMIRLPVARREEDDLLDRLVEEAPGMLELASTLDPEELSAVKVALLLRDWIEEAPDEQLLSRYNVGPGDIAAIAETGAWIAGSLARILPLMGARERDASILASLSQRIRHGVREELLPLVAIPGIGRVRARRLYQAGYRTLLDLAQADARSLLRVPGIGPAVARQILEFLGRPVEGLPSGRGEGLERFM